MAIGAAMAVSVALPLVATGADGNACSPTSTTTTTTPTTTTTAPGDCPPPPTETTPTATAPKPPPPATAPAPPPPATTTSPAAPAPKPRPRHRKRRRSHRRHATAPRGRERRSRTRTRPRHRQRLVPITSLARGPLPDPLPPGKRLDAGFARLLRRISAEQHASWPLVLARLREHGESGAAPAGPDVLRSLARERARPSERVRALADFNRAVGLDGLVRGLGAVKRRLGERVLNDPSINLYPAGWGDIQRQHVDVRVLVTMLYLAQRHHGITVSCLISGHGLLTRSGNVSLHSSGRAVDIAAVGDVPVFGHQQPGGITERALRSVLLLPRELRPSELISLFALGGPSFAQADHADHIHVGF